MRESILVIAIVMLPASSALAEPPDGQKSVRTATSGKQLPLKRATSANSCAAFGAGFVMVEGTNACVKIGGVVSTGASAYMGAR